MEHTPVLLHEVIAALQPTSTGCYIDGTLGDGGHAAAILAHSQPNGTLLGLDQDSRQIEVAKSHLQPFGQRATCIESRFSHLQEVAEKHGFTEVDGILLDLGISSRQLADSSYGLSFDDEAPLDMRLSSSLHHSAADYLNRANEVEIADVLYRHGDRHNSRALARKIVQFRRHQQFQQAGDVKRALGLTHPSALAPIFQALRIAVNQEADELSAVLPQALHLLKPGGKLAVITFHSGEDRMVKHFLLTHRSELQRQKLIRPSYEEIKRNSRARSALLRVAIKEREVRS